MDYFDGPYFDTSLIGVDGKLARLHKGEPEKPKQPSPAPVKGVMATNIMTSKERDPSRRMRGSSSTILTNGYNTGFGGKTILGA